MKTMIYPVYGATQNLLVCCQDVTRSIHGLNRSNDVLKHIVEVNMRKISLIEEMSI